MERIFFIIGSLLAGFSVAMGAFAAHGATKFMTEQQLGWMEKAARYNMYHALAILVIAWAVTQWPGQISMLSWAGWLFMSGIALFSGSLYIMAFSPDWRIRNRGVSPDTGRGRIRFRIPIQIANYRQGYDSICNQPVG